MAEQDDASSDSDSDDVGGFQYVESHRMPAAAAPALHRLEDWADPVKTFTDASAADAQRNWLQLTFGGVLGCKPAKKTILTELGAKLAAKRKLDQLLFSGVDLAYIDRSAPRGTRRACTVPLCLPKGRVLVTSNRAPAFAGESADFPFLTLQQ